MYYRDYVSVNPDVHHADPCITGTRIPVSILVASLADGTSMEEVLDAYPQLESKHILAALEYAAQHPGGV